MKTIASTIALPQLNLGDTGSAVLFVQQVLISCYCYKSVTANGQFDEKTEAAVKEFQGWNSLVADGIVGELTWDALGRYLGS